MINEIRARKTFAICNISVSLLEYKNAKEDFGGYMKSLIQKLGIIGIFLAIFSNCLGVPQPSEKEATISLLSKIEESLVYWKIQKNSPKRYLLSQGPRAWLVNWRGTAEIENQIEKNIQGLETKQNELFQKLGGLQEDSNDPKQVQDGERSFIVSCLKPSHMQRNAFSYTLIGAGVVVAGVAAYRSSHQLRAVAKNFLGFWKSSNVQQSRMAVVNTKTVRDDLYSRFVRYANAMRQGFADKIDGLVISEEKKNALNQAVKSGDSVKATELMAGLDKELRLKFSTERPGFKSIFGINGLKNNMYNAAQGVILSNFDVSFLFLADQLRDYMKWMLYDVWDPLESSQQHLYNEIEHLRNRLKALAWQVPCAVAALGLGIGIKKMLGSRKNNNFQLLRITLNDISNVIDHTEYHAGDEEKGKLSYYCHKLRTQIRKFLPNGEIRVQIEDQLKDFETKTSQDKKCIIEGLSKTYSCFCA